MNNLIILKLGGSILTLKEKNKYIFRTRTVKRIIDEIKKAQTLDQFQLILVHGVGSFGHPVGKKYKLDRGYLDASSIIGVAKSKRQGFLLNGLLWKHLESKDLSTVTIQSSAIIRSINGKVANIDIKIIKDFLGLGLLVTLFGDEVIDLETKFSICSSDQIAVYLAEKLEAKLLLFATDVNGVYNLNPKTHLKAKRLEFINKSDISEIIKTIKPHNKFDTSGEMWGKLNTIASSNLSKNTKIQIFDGLKPNSIYKTLSGKLVGTAIEI